MAIDLVEELDHTDGDDNTAGIAQYIYIAKVKDIATLPKPVLDDSSGEGSLEDLVTINDDIIMKSGKSFMKTYVTLETGKLDDESQGELDGMSFLNKLEFLIPGSKKKVLGFKQFAKNGSFIILVPEQDGQVRMLGHAAYPAKMISAPGTTGQKSADRKGNTFTFQSARKGPAPIFEGQVKVSGVGSGVDFDADGNQDILFID